MIRPDSIEHLRRSIDAIPEKTEEEQKLWQAESAGFSPVHPLLDDLYECYDCGAVVHDWRTHRDWHTKYAP